MENKEFNLTKEIEVGQVSAPKLDSSDVEFLRVKDVKEYIKILRENSTCPLCHCRKSHHNQMACKNDNFLIVIKDLDKLAGDKLI